MDSLTGAVLIISIAAHVLLLMFVQLRGGQIRAGRWWLSLTVLLSLLATSADLLLGQTLFADVLSGGFVAALALSAMLTTFGALVITDISKVSPRYWLLLGAVVLAAMIGSAVLIDAEGLIVGQSEWLVRAFVTSDIPALITLAGFSVQMIALLGFAFYRFYVAPLPEIANRALFWVMDGALLLVGVVLVMSGTDVLIVPGAVILLLGLTGATYALTSFRVLDVRGWVTVILRVVLSVPFTAVVIFATLVIADNMRTNGGTNALLWVVLALAAALVYVPIRQLVLVLVERLTAPPYTDAAQATKEYSQQVSRAVELDQLTQTVTDTLNRVMRVRRSALFLVNDSETDTAELMPAGSNHDANITMGHLSKYSPIYRHLAITQAPLSQYDVEFNPVYDGISETERGFFGNLGMSAYAPIIAEDGLIGLLACGAKVNDAPFFPADLELLATIASQTSIALRNARLVTDLRQLNESMSTLNVDLGGANEQLERLDSVKTDFITIASHELRTPLAQVRGYIDIMDALNEQGMLDRDQTSGMMSNLRKATERMEELIAAMLDVSQLDVDAMDLRFSQAAPESVLRMAIEPLTDAIKQRKLTLSARGLRGLPAVQADMQRLVQAFRNIIVNAIKFTPDGGRIEITASLQKGGKPGEQDYILVAISDTGVGIAKENLELIFKKFYRAYDPGLHSTGTYKFLGAGPGLGLTIAKGVIEGHGGKIWAESEGHDMEQYPGTTFYVILPLTPPEGARRVSPFDRHKTAPLSPPNALPAIAQQ